VDGKHVRIVLLALSGSNYKTKSHSIVLMTIANDNYELIFVDIGRNEEFLTRVCFSK
jgi:hypothetical protein